MPGRACQLPLEGERPIDDGLRDRDARMARRAIGGSCRSLGSGAVRLFEIDDSAGGDSPGLEERLDDVSHLRPGVAAGQSALVGEVDGHWLPLIARRQS